MGAQIPVGVGAAFAEMYKAKKQWPCAIGVAMYGERAHRQRRPPNRRPTPPSIALQTSPYLTEAPPPSLTSPSPPPAGDGAANQGQVYEAANMAKLWDVPAVLVCENNQYGMGTSTKRSTANDEYYKQGGVVIPGIQADGMDYLAAREAWRYAKAHAGSGKGPIYLEFKTYRYHGHSMSDPGITYRDRDEVAGMRASKDCIEQTKKRIVDAGWATDDELKAVEKDIRAAVTAEVAEAAAGSLPPLEILYEDIYQNEKPAFIRGATWDNSLRF